MNEMRRVTALGAAALLAGLSMLTGCGGKTSDDRKAAETMAEGAVKTATGEDVDVKLKGKNVSIRGEGMSADMIETTVWPADIFPEVPEFAYGKVQRVHKGEEGGMKKFNVYFHDVESGGVERYAELLRQQGWQATLTTMGSQGGMLNGQKGDIGMNFMFNLERKDGMLAVYTQGGQ